MGTSHEHGAPSRPRASAPRRRSGRGPEGRYLYGVVRSACASADALPLDGSLELVVRGGVAAVVGRVDLREFAPEALEARLQDAAWLEARARAHDAVVEQVHRRCAVLPAKFGAVYARVEDVAGALERDEPALLAALARVDGRDEWLVHLHADAGALERAVDRAAREQLAPQDRDADGAATPGRAYLLRRRLEHEREGARERVLGELAAAGYGALSARADDARVVPRAGPWSPAEGDEREVLRAAFLVRRDAVDAFLAGLREFAAAQEGVRCEHTGPLPPYSFAVPSRDDEAPP